MADLVHYMGGGIRKDFSAKVTHLVAMRSGGEKYRVCLLTFSEHYMIHIHALLSNVAGYLMIG